VGREPLIVVFVAREDHIRVEVVKRLPDRLHLRAASMGGAVVEERVMAIGERARRRKSFQVVAQPAFLLGTLITRWRPVSEERRIGAFAVDHDDVPGAKVVAVIGLFQVPTCNLPGLVLPRLPPVLEETPRSVGHVFMITDSGAGPVPQRRPAPRLVIASEGRVTAA